jgi:hypothetical protein
MSDLPKGSFLKSGRSPDRRRSLPLTMTGLRAGHRSCSGAGAPVGFGILPGWTMGPRVTARSTTWPGTRLPTCGLGKAREALVLDQLLELGFVADRI